jgi:hypothetical protein
MSKNPNQQQQQQQRISNPNTTTTTASSSNSSLQTSASTTTSTTLTTTVTKTQGSTNVYETVDFRLFETIEYPFCADVSKYEKILKIGQGTFGEVHKAKYKGTDKLVALKKVLTDNEKEGVS